MNQRFVLAVCLLATLSACNTAPTASDSNELAAELVVRVKVIHEEAVPFGADRCLPGPCVSGHQWFSYRARVVDVLQGEWSAPIISFAAYQPSAYVSGVLEDWYIRIKLNPDQVLARELAAPYYVERHTAPYFADFEQAIEGLE